MDYKKLRKFNNSVKDSCNRYLINISTVLIGLLLLTITI